MRKSLTELIKQALLEDDFDNDITTLNLIGKEEIISGSFIVKTTGVVSGIDIVKEVYRLVSPKIKLNILKENGTYVNRGDVIASIEGPMRDVLRAEKVALNFLQRMSGIAGTTAKYVAELAGLECKILDTRQTTPLLREFEKLAVTHGGAFNSVFSLSEKVILTDNHITSAGGIKPAVDEIKKILGRSTKIEVEVSNKEEFMEAYSTTVESIILKNIPLDIMKEIVEINDHKKKLIASGHEDLRKIRSVALTGVDYIALESITNSYKSLDIIFKTYKKRGN